MTAWLPPIILHPRIPHHAIERPLELPMPSWFILVLVISAALTILKLLLISGLLPFRTDLRIIPSSESGNLKGHPDPMVRTRQAPPS